MSPLLRWARSMTTVAAVPAGIAAAFALQAPAARAASDANFHPAGITRLAAAGQQQKLATMQMLRYRLPPRLRAYRWAARQKGHPYVWGGTGPGFDCSGLVMEAYLHVGIRLPRTTTEMLGSRKLIRVRHPRMGDLAVYGTARRSQFDRDRRAVRGVVAQEERDREREPVAPELIAV